MYLAALVSLGIPDGAAPLLPLAGFVEIEDPFLAKAQLNVNLEEYLATVLTLNLFRRLDINCDGTNQ